MVFAPRRVRLECRWCKRTSQCRQDSLSRWFGNCARAPIAARSTHTRSLIDKSISVHALTPLPFLPPRSYTHSIAITDGSSFAPRCPSCVMADEGTPLRLSVSTSITTASSSSNTPGGGGNTPIRRPSFLTSKPPPPPAEGSETAAKKTSKAVKLAIYVFGRFPLSVCLLTLPLCIPIPAPSLLTAQHISRASP